MYVFLSVTYMCVSILWSWFSRFLANTMSFYYLISLSIVIVRCWDMIGSRVVKSLWEQNGCAMCLFNRVASNGFIYWCGHCVTPRWSHGCLIFFLLWNWRGCGPVLIFLRDLAYPLAQGWWCVFTCYVGDQSTWENPSVCLLQG